MMVAQLATIVIARQRAARRRLRAPARTGDNSECIIHDLSATGFLATVDGPLAIDDELTLMLPGLDPRAAVVVRVGGDDRGCRFVVPLSLDEVEQAGRLGNVRHVHFGSALGRFRAPGAADTDLHPAALQPLSLSLRARVGIIVGLSLGLWTGLILLAWRVIG